LDPQWNGVGLEARSTSKTGDQKEIKVLADVFVALYSSINSNYLKYKLPHQMNKESESLRLALKVHSMPHNFLLKEILTSVGALKIFDFNYIWNLCGSINSGSCSYSLEARTKDPMVLPSL